MKMAITQALCCTLVQELFLFSLCYIFVQTVSLSYLFLLIFSTLIRTWRNFQADEFLISEQFSRLIAGCSFLYVRFLLAGTRCLR